MSINLTKSLTYSYMTFFFSEVHRAGQNSENYLINLEKNYEGQLHSALKLSSLSKLEKMLIKHLPE